MKKILTVSIAAYNIQKFIDKALNSLVISDSNEFEVLIINDGSKDDTLQIAKEYEKKYPNIFKVINKVNGGYGSTINAGIKYASGKYFKQLDGDDWYDTNNLKEILSILKTSDEDIIYTPYYLFFEKDNSIKTIHNKIEKNLNSVLIDEVIKLADPYLPMHSLMFKTDILKKHNIQILENCFYTDVEYAVYPFLFAKTIKIVNIPLYVYRIGREGQSVSIEGRIKHYKDHLKVDNKMLDILKNNTKLKKNVLKYLKKYFSSIFASCMSNYLLILKSNRENYNLIKEYDKKIYEVDKEVYNKMGEISGSVKYLRKFGYIGYKLLHCIKIVKEKINR